SRPLPSTTLFRSLPDARVGVGRCAAVARVPLALLRRPRARRARLRDLVPVRDLVVADDVLAVARGLVLRREVLDELRARGVLLLGEGLRRVADVLDADAALVVVEVARVPGGRLLGHELPDATVDVDDVLAALVRIVLQCRDARVPVALGVVDDDELDGVARAARRALV